MSTSSHADQLRLILYCPVCESNTNHLHARTLGKQKETQLFHVQCRKCQHSFLSLVLVNRVGASSVGLLTDLAYEDVMRFHHNRSVSVNDVISTHEFFEKGAWVTRFVPVLGSRQMVKRQMKRVKNNP